MKKHYLASILLMTGFAANAASQIDFNIEATVPAQEFYVNSNNGWEAQTQKMTWNSSRNLLNDITQQLVMKNTTGGIKAYLAAQPVLSGSESSDTINLDVKISGKSLPADAASAVTLFSADEAKIEKTVSMVVTQANTDKPAAGNYIGSVTMMFDTVVQ